VLVFSLTALGALAAISGKYGRRQTRIELQYQGRERIAAERGAGNGSTAMERNDGQAIRREFASPGDSLIPLWPLEVILAIVAIFASVLLAQGRVRLGSRIDESTPP